MIHQRHRQTDRRTDKMRSQDRALHYSASRGKNGAFYSRGLLVMPTYNTTEALYWK